MKIIVQHKNNQYQVIKEYNKNRRKKAGEYKTKIDAIRNAVNIAKKNKQKTEVIIPANPPKRVIN